MFKLAEVALQAPSNSPAKWIAPPPIIVLAEELVNRAERRWEPVTTCSVPSTYFTLNDMVDFKQEGELRFRIAIKWDPAVKRKGQIPAVGTSFPLVSLTWFDTMPDEDS